MSVFLTFATPEDPDVPNPGTLHLKSTVPFFIRTSRYTEQTTQLMGGRHVAHAYLLHQRYTVAIIGALDLSSPNANSIDLYHSIFRSVHISADLR